jgi:hypothetical protein
MNSQNEKINDLVKLRFQKAIETFAEIEDDIIPLIDPVKNFIDKIKQLLTNL